MTCSGQARERETEREVERGAMVVYIRKRPTAPYNLERWGNKVKKRKRSSEATKRIANCDEMPD